MPYIFQDDREKFQPSIQECSALLLDAFVSYTGELQQSITALSKKVGDLYRSIGDVNYFMSVVLWTYFDLKQSYSRLNEITDALNGVYDRLFLGSTHIPSRLELVLFPYFSEANRRFGGVRGLIRDIEHEFRRRRGDIYEDGKIANPDNGDIL